MRKVDVDDHDGEDKKTADDDDDDDNDDDGSSSWGQSCRIRFTLKENSKRTVLY